jgi:hypothetical protein
MGTLSEPQYERVILLSTSSKPEVEQDWVEFNLNPLGGDMVAAFADAGEQETSAGERTLALLTALIKSWSFVDDAGNSLPITSANVRRMAMVDLSELVQKVEPALKALGEGTISEKKDVTSSSSSPAPETAIP